MNLNELHNIETGDWSVGDILSAYYNTTTNDLFDALSDDVEGMLGYWANANNMSPGALVGHIDEQFYKVANKDNGIVFKVLKDVGSGGGWPECVLAINDISLNFDWVIDAA